MTITKTIHMKIPTTIHMKMTCWFPFGFLLLSFWFPFALLLASFWLPFGFLNKLIGVSLVKFSFVYIYIYIYIFLPLSVVECCEAIEGRRNARSD